MKGAKTLFWILPLVLTLWGVVVILSMTGWSSHGSAVKQLIWALVSFFIFLIVRQIPTNLWFRHRGKIVLIMGVFMLVTLTPLGATVKGASRWIDFGIMKFQPSEGLMVALPLLMIPVYQKCPYVWRAILITLIVGGAFGLLLLLQPDFGSLLLLIGVLGALVVERYGFAVPLICLVPMTAVLYLFATMGYRMDRIEIWKTPWLDPMGAGYQVIQGLIAFANGGLWGIGIHRSQDFLPEVHNDFIFPALAEQFGLVGSLATLFAFLVMVVWGWNLYRKAEVTRRPLIWGMTVALILPLFVNVGGVTKLIPLSGMPLPFISYGGTSLLFCWIKVALICRAAQEE